MSYFWMRVVSPLFYNFCLLVFNQLGSRWNSWKTRSNWCKRPEGKCKGKSYAIWILNYIRTVWLCYVSLTKLDTKILASTESFILSQLVYTFYWNFARKRFLKTFKKSLKKQLKKYIYTTFRRSQTSLSSEKEIVWIFFKYKKNNSSLKI